MRSYNAAVTGENLRADKPPPSRLVSVLKPLLISVYSMVFFFAMVPHFPILDPDDPQHNLPVFLAQVTAGIPWVGRLTYQTIALFVNRHKYFLCWKSAEGATNVWYGGFEGYDDKGEEKGWEIR